MSRKKQPFVSKRGELEKQKDNTGIYVAIIGVIGTIIVAIMSNINVRTQIGLPIKATQTAEARLTTFPDFFATATQLDLQNISTQVAFSTQAKEIEQAATAAILMATQLSLLNIQTQQAFNTQIKSTEDSMSTTATAIFQIQATAQPNKPPILITDSVIEVVADQSWQDSKISVLEGDNITLIYVAGEWNPCAPPYGCPYVGANGWPAWNYDVVLEDCPHAALIVQLPNSIIFCAKSFFTVQARASGTIKFRINDTRLDDDTGSLFVEVKVER
jgi:hypothetical protein